MIEGIGLKRQYNSIMNEIGELETKIQEKKEQLNAQSNPIMKVILQW
jgi:TATA-binding protein-associated factor Taf7